MNFKLSLAHVELKGDRVAVKPHQALIAIVLTGDMVSTRIPILCVDAGAPPAPNVVLFDGVPGDWIALGAAIVESDHEAGELAEFLDGATRLAEKSPLAGALRVGAVVSAATARGLIREPLEALLGALTARESVYLYGFSAEFHTTSNVPQSLTIESHSATVGLNLVASAEGDGAEPDAAPLGEAAEEARKERAERLQKKVENQHAALAVFLASDPPATPPEGE